MLFDFSSKALSACSPGVVSIKTFSLEKEEETFQLLNISILLVLSSSSIFSTLATLEGNLRPRGPLPLLVPPRGPVFACDWSWGPSLDSVSGEDNFFSKEGGSCPGFTIPGSANSPFNLLVKSAFVVSLVIEESVCFLAISAEAVVAEELPLLCRSCCCCFCNIS
ncbi:hypothetical protein AWRI1631_91510 [Saccharomyces cerevisiae AWRI1631]|uniref:Uncharacterized protein n=1 Tax=Saccharomyces cerevisiae (strain AWRI1631) TaxID=545124 RepID=B5VKT8_YEAS6|nr:hypothetical protein AWRI1631_91510 [Saccharomyces cerevisiae AWRI1631]